MLSEILVALIGTLLTVFLIPWLRAKAFEAKARAKESTANFGSKLLSTLQYATAEYVANTMERDYPKIALLIKSDFEITSEDVKKKLHELGDDVFRNLILTFARQGIDLLSEVGENHIREIIRRQVDKDSPFQKRESATAFMKPNIATRILEKGLKDLGEKNEKDSNDSTDSLDFSSN